MLYNRQIWNTGEKLTFNGTLDTKRLLNTDKIFKLKNDQTVIGDFLLSWKISFSRGIKIEKKETTFEEFKSNLNEIKR